MPSLLSDFDELCITQRDAFLQTVPCIDPLNSCTGVIVEGNDDEYPDGRRYQALDGQA